MRDEIEDGLMWMESVITSEGKRMTLKKKHRSDVTKDRFPGQVIIFLNTPNT